MTAEQGFSDFFYSAPDGLKLHARSYGAGTTGAVPVVCLPGLSRNARDFHELALHLSRREERPRQVVVFDYRGRGLSAYDRNWRNYDVRIEAGRRRCRADRGAASKRPISSARRAAA